MPSQSQPESGVQVSRSGYSVQLHNAGITAFSLYNPADVVAECFDNIFPDCPREVLAASVQRYQDAGFWATHPQIGRPGYDRMRDALIAGGLVHGYHPYESIVQPQFAERAAAGLA